VILLGLGNPGGEYQETRHNAGFLLADAARRYWGGASWSQRPHAQECRIRISGREHRLVRPTTFMNRSGLAVAELLREGVQPGEMLVLLDDIDLALGRLRVRLSGGSGGHRGLQSVLEAIGDTQVARLRIGVGRPSEAREVVDHVLERFDAQEWEHFGQVIERCLGVLGLALTRGVEAAMNRYNGLASPWEADEPVSPRRRRGGVGLDNAASDEAK
jgi:peptidyl-tRNA hydrolase, PTH1 family